MRAVDSALGLAGVAFAAVMLGVGTGEAPIDAEVVEFATLDALKAAPEGSLEGKIAVITNRMVRFKDGRGYGPAVGARSQGAVEAARQAAAQQERDRLAAAQLAAAEQEAQAAAAQAAARQQAAQIEAERARTDEQRATWAELCRQWGGHAAAVALVVLTGIAPAPADASQQSTPIDALQSATSYCFQNLHRDTRLRSQHIEQKRFATRSSDAEKQKFKLK